MTCPIPHATGHLRPEGRCDNGVMLLGEAMGEAEAREGLPFRPWAEAGSVLERAITRAGFHRDQFLLWNAVPTHPPKNYLVGAEYEEEAIRWGLPFVRDLVERFHVRAILALGDVPLGQLTGHREIMKNRGYPIWSHSVGVPVIGTLHPSFLRRGAMSYLGVLIHDLRFAVELARHSERVEFHSPVLRRPVHYGPFYLEGGLSDLSPLGYIEYPSEDDGWEFLERVERQKDILVAYDIETPRSHSIDEENSDDLDESEIVSIQFSLAPESGIYFPWRDPFIEIARRVLRTGNPKVGANCWRFDDPRLRAHDVDIQGPQHDLRWAWKHFQPDLSGGLQFITSYYAPELGIWKHTSQSNPRMYGIRDVDALQRVMGERDGLAS